MEIFTHVLPKLGGFLVREWVWAVVMLSHVLPPRGVSLTSTTDHKERDWTKWWCEITLKAERTYMFTWNEMKGSDEVWFYWSQYSKHVHCVTSKFHFILILHIISLYIWHPHIDFWFDDWDVVINSVFCICKKLFHCAHAGMLNWLCFLNCFSHGNHWLILSDVWFYYPCRTFSPHNVGKTWPTHTQVLKQWFIRKLLSPVD